MVCAVLGSVSLVSSGDELGSGPVGFFVCWLLLGLRLGL